MTHIPATFRHKDGTQLHLRLLESSPFIRTYIFNDQLHLSRSPCGHFLGAHTFRYFTLAPRTAGDASLLYLETD